MNVLNRWAAAALAAAVPLALAATNADAAPLRTAATTSYTTATYLQHALGLPSTDSNPVIEPVTYDRFQWLLQQPGRFAYLIGDPAEDPSFAARAQDVEAAAKAAGVGKVYWFDPNLSGNAKVGGFTEPNLDIRNPAGITAVAAISQAKYDTAWKNLVGQYLGNGLSATVNGLNTETATVTITPDASVVNDDGSTPGHSTEVGNPNGGALYDYSSGSAPANVSDSYFLIYDANHTDQGHPAKIVSWVDLTTEPGPAQADVTAAIGNANLTALDQFAWWKSEINAKQARQGAQPYQGANVPVLSDADSADGWRVEQITYPELVDLLKNADDANAVILFGGTWCPNTRPVIGSVNRYAQRNDVHVFNFDTVLDGGLAGGSTTQAVNPFQVRNTVAYTSGGVTTPNANPTSLYGDVVNHYLTNINTEYDYTKGGPGVTYYPGGDSSGTVTNAKKLQVPFVIGYQGAAGDAPHGGVTRQWIIDNGDGTYKEYMSQWWYTNPQPGQLGISTIPSNAPVWSTINAQLASLTWQSDPHALYANTTVDTDDAQYLVDTDKATVTHTATGWTITSGANGTTVISPAALSAALSALGASAPANLAAAKSALLAAQDPTAISNLTTVVGAWGVAQSRKNTVNSTWGSATTPGSVAGGLAAVHALDVFFAGLPSIPPPPQGGQNTGPAPISAAVPTPKVVKIKASKLKGAVSKAPTSRKRGKYKVTITTPKGRAAATGKVTIKFRKGKTTRTVTGRLSHGAVTVTVPRLARGTWKVTIAWPGDSTYLPASATGASIKVRK